MIPCAKFRDFIKYIEYKRKEQIDACVKIINVRNEFVPFRQLLGLEVKDKGKMTMKEFHKFLMVGIFFSSIYRHVITFT